MYTSNMLYQLGKMRQEEFVRQAHEREQLREALQVRSRRPKHLRTILPALLLWIGRILPF